MKMPLRPEFINRPNEGATTRQRALRIADYTLGEDDADDRDIDFAD